jgi:hypothetical protein
MNGDIGLVFSTKPIMDAYYVLTVLFIGYFLYLFFFRNRRNYHNNVTKEIEVFLNILTLGLPPFVFLYLILALSGYREILLGRFFQGVISLFILLIFLCHLFRHRIPNLNYRRSLLVLLILIVFLYAYANFLIDTLLFFKFTDKCELIKMPFISNEKIEGLGLNQSEYCLYECYSNYKAFSYKVSPIEIINNSTGFHCLCDVSYCKMENL